MAWTILVKDHQRNISAKWYWNGTSGFWQEDFLSFLYRYIGKISPAPWRPCFLMNPNGLNNLGRGSPKEHFCKMILKSVQWFLTRRFFFMVLVKKCIFSSCDLDMQRTKIIWTTLKEDQPRIIPVKFGQIPIKWFRRRCCLKNVNGQTDGRGRRRRTVGDHNSSPWAFGSGELKTYEKH